MTTPNEATEAAAQAFRDAAQMTLTDLAVDHTTAVHLARRFQHQASVIEQEATI